MTHSMTRTVDALRSTGWVLLQFVAGLLFVMASFRFLGGKWGFIVVVVGMVLGTFVEMYVAEGKERDRDALGGETVCERDF